jgi:hypothetical protein
MRWRLTWLMRLRQRGTVGLAVHGHAERNAHLYVNRLTQLRHFQPVPPPVGAFNWGGTMSLGLFLDLPKSLQIVLYCRAFAERSPEARQTRLL